MKNFNVAMLQLLPEGSLSANLDKGLEYCKKAKDFLLSFTLFLLSFNFIQQLPFFFCKLTIFQ